MLVSSAQPCGICRRLKILGAIPILWPSVRPPSFLHIPPGPSATRESLDYTGACPPDRATLTNSTHSSDAVQTAVCMCVHTHARHWLGSVPGRVYAISQPAHSAKRVLSRVHVPWMSRILLLACSCHRAPLVTGLQSSFRAARAQQFSPPPPSPASQPFFAFCLDVCSPTVLHALLCGLLPFVFLFFSSYKEKKTSILEQDASPQSGQGRQHHPFLPGYLGRKKPAVAVSRPAGGVVRGSSGQPQTQCRFFPRLGR